MTLFNDLLSIGVFALNTSTFAFNAFDFVKETAKRERIDIIDDERVETL